MQLSASLRPVAGEPAEVQRLVEDWLSGQNSPPLTIRTSGSTGQPKDVALSAAAVTASAAATLDRIGGPGQWVLALPVRYVAGLQVVVRSVLSRTTPVVLAEQPSLAVAARLLTGRRRYLALVPTQLHRMVTDPAESEALAGFDAVLLGGAAAAPELLDRARAAGVGVVTTYGMSETCGGCVYDGWPLEGVEVRLGENDRVLLRGPMLFDGYVDQPELTACALRDGWLHTPDVGRLDPSGRLEILGRRDDVVVSGGVNISLGAVERRLLEHPFIQDAAVVGRHDPAWGTRVVAFVVAVRGHQSPTTETLRDFVSEVHPREWAPREVTRLAALPLLESGKVDRQALVRGMATRDG
jgi:O-succinylbenzoic acid--CoA ligase